MRKRRKSHTKKEKDEPKVIAKGYVGTVVHPSPGISKAKHFAGPLYVMKCAPAKNSFQTLRIANHIRATWHSKSQSALEDYFILPEPRVRDLSKEPLGPSVNVGKEADIGMFMKHGGVCWDKHFAKGSVADLTMVAHVITGVLLLHAMNVTHSDLQPHNILIGRDGLARLIDWETAVLHSPRGRERLDDQIPMDTGRWFYFLFSGRLHHSKRLQIAFDWRRLAKLLEETWADKANPKLSKVTLLLRKGTDEDAFAAGEMLRGTQKQNVIP
jgi:hypothetical protein